MEMQMSSKTYPEKHTNSMPYNGILNSLSREHLGAPMYSVASVFGVPERFVEDVFQYVFFYLLPIVCPACKDTPFGECPF